jgi:hypothetical protein
MTIRDILAARRAELEAQVKDLMIELAQIDAAEKAIEGVSSGFGPQADFIAPLQPTANADRSASKPRDGTIKDWICKALAANAHGLETEAVIEAVKQLGGPEVIRSSMSPQLSRLKSDGVIKQVGRLWILEPQAYIKPEVEITSEDLLG